jgi:hypothetical protein
MTDKPITRECVHQRKINLEGYARSDGLLDIEGEIIDTKNYDFPNRERGIIKAGEALHHMKVKITVNDALTIVDAQAETLAGPFRICPSATIAFVNMIGVQIGPGWRAKVRQAIGGITGCTHITELMGPVATVAIQTFFGEKGRKKRESGKSEEKSNNVNILADSCLGHAVDQDTALTLAEEKRKSAQEPMI